MTEIERYQFDCSTLAANLYYGSLISALEQAARDKVPIRTGVVRRWSTLVPEEQRVWLKEAGQELTVKGIVYPNPISDENWQHPTLLDEILPNMKDIKPF